MKGFNWRNFSLRKHLPSDEVFPENRVTAFLKRAGSLAQRYPALVILFFASFVVVVFLPFLYLTLPGNQARPSEASGQSYSNQSSGQVRSLQGGTGKRGQRRLPVNRSTLAGNWIGLSGPSSGSGVARWMAFRADGQYQVLQDGHLGLGHWTFTGRQGDTRRGDTRQGGAGKPEVTVRFRFHNLKGTPVGPPHTEVFRIRLSKGRPRKARIPPIGKQEKGETIHLSGRELRLFAPDGDAFIFGRPREGTFEKVPPASRLPR